jgi:hypothetical protein
VIGCVSVLWSPVSLSERLREVRGKLEAVLKHNPNQE